MEKLNAVRGKILLLSVFLLLFVCGCGGGGGGDSAPAATPGPAPVLPDSINYSVREPGDNSWFHLTIPPGSPPPEVSFSAISLDGTYNRVSRNATLAVGSGISFSVTGIGDYSTVSRFDLSIGTEVQWNGDSRPTAGSFFVTINPSDAFFFDGVLVSVIDNVGSVPGNAGVSIQAYLNGSPLMEQNAEYTWDDFEAIQQSDGSFGLYVRVARFGYGVWKLLFQHVWIAFETLKNIILNNDDIEADGNITVQGAVFPPAGTPGTESIVWIDRNGNQRIDADDEFDANFSMWWVDDDPGDNVGYLYNNIQRLKDYVKSPRGPVGGEFLFTNFSRQEYEVTPPALISTSTARDGFNMTISW